MSNLYKDRDENGKDRFVTEDGKPDGWGMVLDPPIEVADPESFIADLAKTIKDEDSHE